MTKYTHGGPRSGAGRPKKDYKTVTVSFRVRVEWMAIIQEMVKKKIIELKKNKVMDMPYRLTVENMITGEITTTTFETYPKAYGEYFLETWDKLPGVSVPSPEEGFEEALTAGGGVCPYKITLTIEKQKAAESLQRPPSS